MSLDTMGSQYKASYQKNYIKKKEEKAAKIKKRGIRFNTCVRMPDCLK